MINVKELLIMFISAGTLILQLANDTYSVFDQFLQRDQRSEH